MQPNPLALDNFFVSFGWKGLILSSLLIAFQFCSHSQDLRNFDYSKADSIALNVWGELDDLSILVYKLTKDLDTEHEQFRAIFRWITHNISYSYAARWYDNARVMKKRKAVCSGYSHLLEEMCQKAQIQCVVVSGYAKSMDQSVGKFEDTNHAWNAVTLNGVWYLVDATWAAGHFEKRKFVRVFDPHYFLADPEKFIHRHLPEDRKWTLLDKPMKKRKFEQAALKREVFFDLIDFEKQEPKGIVRHKLSFTFSSFYPLSEIAIKSKRNDTFHKIPFTREGDTYTIDYKLEDLRSGYFNLFIDRYAVMTFLKK